MKKREIEGNRGQVHCITFKGEIGVRIAAGQGIFSAGWCNGDSFNSGCTERCNIKKMKMFAGILIVCILGCDTFYKAAVKNESNISITFVGRNNPKDGSIILPKSGRTIGWDDSCQEVIVEDKKIYLDTASAPYESLTIGRTTPGVFSISFDGENFYFVLTPKEKVKIQQLYSCKQKK